MVSSLAPTTPELSKVSLGSASGGVTCHVADCVDAIPLADWQRICDQHDALMDPRLLASVEASAPADNRFWYLTFYNDAREPIAAACVSLFVIDALIFSPNWVRRLLGVVRKIIPRYLKFRVLFCGLPLSSGCSHLRLADGADGKTVMTALNHELDKLRRSQRAWIIVAKEFDEQERSFMDSLVAQRFLRVDSLGMNTFRHPYPSYDAFLADVRSHYRYKINRSRKKFAKAGMIAEHVADPEKILALYTPELHQLYVDVVNRAEHKLEILPHQFFVELASRFGGQVSLTVICQQEKVVAFGWGLKTGDTYRNLFIGIDYTVNDDSDMYFNLMMHELDYALRLGSQEILVGQTSDVFKSRLGCQAEPRFVYIKATARWLHWLMLATSGWLFQLPPPPPRRDLLKPAEEETDGESEADGSSAAGR